MDNTTRNRITNRHIAKVLTRLGDTVAPVIQNEIKRQMWFLSDDLTSENQEISNYDNEKENNFNR